jgi:hypothetical protein
MVCEEPMPTTCRADRQSADGERTLDQAGVKDEWALYADSDVS